MVTAPEENQFVVVRPYEHERAVRQLIEVTTEALETLMRQWEIEELCIIISAYYKETVRRGDLPTNDFIDAVKRDLDTHGKLIVKLHPMPHPEGYDPRTGFQMMLTGAVDRGDGYEMVAMLFSADLLRQTREVARAAKEEDE